MAAAVLSWVVVAVWMRGMPAGPGADLGPLGAFAVAWVVMMAAMMLPSVWPTVLVYRRLQAGRRERGDPAVPAGPALLLVGYLAAWTVAGVVGFAVVEAGRTLDIDALRWNRGGPFLVGGVLVAAALYQLTPVKDVCLRHCRGPFSFLLEHWRPGASGAVRMGARHGLWCIGCCWALMAALFALGVMSIPWMVLITLLIAVEKLLPWRRVAMAAVTAALLALGFAAALVPERVPWLTPPAATMADMPGMATSGTSGAPMAGLDLPR